MKQKKEEEKKEQIQEKKNKEKEEEKLHKEEQKKFLAQQNKKMKEQFKQIQQQKKDFLKKKQELLPENQKIPKTNKNYFKEEKNYIEFDRNLIPKLQTLMNSTNNISNYIKIYDQHLRLIFDIYHKIGQNKITSNNNDDSLYLNEYKEFLTNFGLLNLLITKEQMNFIYKRFTRNFENKELKEKEHEQKQYLTYNDFRTSILLLTIMTHMNNKELKITEDDYNLLEISKIEELFDYLGLKIPYIKKDIEGLINSRRGMTAKDFFAWQQKMKKEYYDKFKGIQRKPNERRNSTIPHSNRPKSSVKINKKVLNNNININLKRVASKEDIDERKNLFKKNIYKTENRSTTQTITKKDSKLIDNKFNIKSNSNNKNNKIENNSINNKSESKSKSRNNSLESNKKSKVEKKIVKNKINNKNLNIQKNNVKEETNNIKIKKTKEDEKKEIKISKKLKDEKIDKDINNINENNNKTNKILNNSDVSIVYTSSEKNQNEALIEENKNINESKKENIHEINNEKEINENINKDININKDLEDIKKIKNQKNEEIKNSNLKDKNNGFNMKIKTADGKEENWNIQE